MSASGSALSRVRGEVARRLARWAPRRRWPFGPRPAQGARGAQLGAAAAEPPRSRRDKLLCGLKLDGLGLEIGPSHAPVAPKREGFNVHVVDHLPAEELRRKYVGHDVDLDAIEAVDFIWRGEPLDATVGAVERYDWIIASHVIEHVPDVIGFLCSCEALLKDGGVLSLAVPDKRYCFDLFRWPSSTGDALQAHTERRRG
ncbi:MAG: class I SAM-dependent methyltransferase, partial [Thiohalocapsa sp.]|nr:class I SAM-dependent methyltransferase [Thiohalocapsa sp.]